MTPQEYVENHEITKSLRRYGIMDGQLHGLGFWGSKTGWAFDLWPFRWLPGTPEEGIHLFRSYCALKWLVLDKPPPSRDREDAERLVSSIAAAPVYKIGIRTKAAQQERARKPRGKITDDKTMDQVVKDLVLNPELRDLRVKELWQPFFASLDEHGLAPEELTDPQDPVKSAYTYDFRDRRKKITYGRFANIVGKHRRKKSR